ncbi:MAG: ABC transporter permease [Armatimonadota bacterium]|nr:ABC transporter permease [Armatimonadota bacterium]
MVERLENPVFRQSSRQRMRGARTYGCLVAYLLTLALVVLVSYDQFMGRGVQRTTTGLAQTLFETLVITQWFLVAFITPALTTSAITMEREQRTFDLLIITPISRFAIVWGKFASAFAFVVVMIVCGVPLVAVLFLMGGVDTRLMVEIYFGMLATGMLLAAYGLMMSAICATSTLANLITYGTLAVGYFIALVVGTTYTMSRVFGGGSVSLLWLGSGLTAWQMWTLFIAVTVLATLILLQIASNYLLSDPRTGAWKTRALTAVLFLVILATTVLDAQSATRSLGGPNYLGGVFAFLWVSIIPLLFTGVPYEDRKWQQWFHPHSLWVGSVQSALPFMLLLMLLTIVADRFMPPPFRTQPLVWAYLAGYLFWIWSLGYLLSLSIRNRWGAWFALVGVLGVWVQAVYSFSLSDFFVNNLQWIDTLVNVALPFAPWETSNKMDYEIWIAVYPLMAVLSLLLSFWQKRRRTRASAGEA